VGIILMLLGVFIIYLLLFVIVLFLFYVLNREDFRGIKLC